MPATAALTHAIGQSAAQEWQGEMYTANFKDAKGWGLGAWGVIGTFPWTHPDEEDRIAWRVLRECARGGRLLVLATGTGGHMWSPRDRGRLPRDRGGRA